MTTILQKEWHSLWVNPFAWVLFALSQFVITYLALIHLQDYILLEDKLKLLANPPGVSQYLIPRFYAPLATLYMLLIPLLAMRMLAEEKRQQTLVLLLASPVGIPAIVIAKFFALFGFFVLMLLCNSLIFLLLGFYAPLDWVSVIWALCGCILFIATCSAIALFFSALGKQAASAALGSYGFFFVLWIISLSGGSQKTTDSLMQYISLSSHLDSFLLGLFSRQDIVYYALLVFLFITLTVHKLGQARRA